MTTTLVATVAFQRGTATTATANNKTLAAGVPGLETDTGKFKIGDGITPWNGLPYHYFWTTWARIDSKPTTLAGYGITNAQGLNANLTALAGLTTATDKLSYWTGSATAGLTDVTSFGRSLIDDANAAGARTTLGIGTIATQNDTGITLTDATLPRLALFRSGIGTWYLGNQAAGGTTNTFQITFNTASALEISTALAATFRGTLSIAGHGTTASGANAFIDSTTGLVSRSTSSLRYKRDVEPMDPACADALLALQPIWYRSAIATDPREWSWWGLAAEEVARIDPRLVHWGYAAEDFDQRRKHEQVLRKGAKLRPLGVAYDRMTVPLLSIVQRMARRLADAEEEIAELKRRTQS